MRQAASHFPATADTFGSACKSQVATRTTSAPMHPPCGLRPASQAHPWCGNGAGQVLICMNCSGRVWFRWPGTLPRRCAPPSLRTGATGHPCRAATNEKQIINRSQTVPSRWFSRASVRMGTASRATCPSTPSSAAESELQRVTLGCASQRMQWSQVRYTVPTR